MRRPVLLSVTALGLVAALVAPTSAQAAPAAPADQAPALGREAPANGPERNARAAEALPTQARPGGQPAEIGARSTATATADPHDEAGYPRQTQLPVHPVDPADASLKLGLIPYHGLAPHLNALQDRSDRVSVEVIGESTLGRDMYLVTVTAPETPAEARRQERMRQRIEQDPAAAAKDPSIRRHYKAPVFINANIHGDEWEGTDAALRVVTELATSTDPAVAELLEHMRLYVNVTNNPDGRVGNTRRNTADFDLNRDWITASQPETRVVREVLIETQPLVMLDLHGYVNGTLIEPTTPPHGQNYEYDLFIKHAYANALGMEQAVLDLGYTEEEDGVSPPVIPFRDWDEGWDDWPPIFTPQYAAFHGAIAHTIEVPLRVNRSSYEELSVEELQRRSAINTAVAAATVRASIRYAYENRAELIADQIEVFRRGAAGEPLHPVEPGDVGGLIGPEDVYTTTFPRAYVIPMARGQRSRPAAARLVDFLVANDVEVTRATGRFRLGGQTYPAGTYVVDMHQPKRGLANVILEAGADISDRVDAMYDISGWSHRLLWGASVDVVEQGRYDVDGEPVVAAVPSGSVRGNGALAMQTRDPKDFAALNDLLSAGVGVTVTADGSVVIPASARELAETVAERHGIVLRPARQTRGVVLDDVVVAAAVASDELWAMTEMGFDVRPVSTEVLNAGYDWSDVDVLFVSSGLSYAELTEEARAGLDAYLADGGVVTRGSTGAAFNAEADLLSVTAVEGRDDANGVVRVSNSGGPVTATALPHTFIYSPLWFTDLGQGVAVEQRYATEDVMVAGHWRPTEEGTGGPTDAAGEASIVRGFDEDGASVVMFGTEPMFRAHPKGLYAQVGRALHWTAVTADLP